LRAADILAKHPNLSSDLSRSVKSSIERAMTFKVIRKAAELDSEECPIGGFFTLMFDIWAVAAILYEEHHAPIISDNTFDLLSRYIATFYDEKVKEGYPRELGLFEKGQFEAGTGMGVAAILADAVHSRIANNIVGLQGTT
jgi:hypothetical protein